MAALAASGPAVADRHENPPTLTNRDVQYFQASPR